MEPTDRELLTDELMEIMKALRKVARYGLVQGNTKLSRKIEQADNRVGDVFRAVFFVPKGARE